MRGMKTMMEREVELEEKPTGLGMLLLLSTSCYKAPEHTHIL